MAPCVKSFLTKPDGLSLVSGTHSRAGEIKLHTDHPCCSMCAPTQINVINHVKRNLLGIVY